MSSETDLAQAKYTYDYPMFALTADMVVFRYHVVDDRTRLQVLLITRGGEPFAGALALPGGYVNIGERAKCAAVRELREETGLVVLPGLVMSVGFFDRVDRNPAGRVVNMAFWCMDPTGTGTMRGHEARFGDDAVGMDWHNVIDVEDKKLTLAFDHAEIVLEALEKLRDQYR